LALKLSVHGVSAGYGAVRALHGVSLDVAQGETVANGDVQRAYLGA